MEKSLLRSKIREDETGNIEKFIWSVKVEDASSYRYRYGYYNYTNKKKADPSEFYAWAKEKGYITSENGQVYQLKTPSVTLTVDNGDCTIHELVGLGNLYSRINLKNVFVTHFERYIEDIPKLIEEMEADAAFVRENYEKIRMVADKKKKTTNFRQTGIEAYIIKRFSDKYNYKVKKNKVRVTVSVEAGGYWLDYPINNGKVDQIATVLDNIEKAVAMIGTLPCGTKIRVRR